MEVFYNNIWGSVCDDGWNVNSAEVVCRQLGLPHEFPQPIDGLYFGHGSGPMWLDDVECLGSEKGLDECDHLEWGRHNCGQHEHAGVICEDRTYCKKIRLYIYNGYKLPSFQ